MMKLILVMFTLMLPAVALVTSCGSPDVSPRDVTDVEGQSVLIAIRSSEFKEKISTKLVADYRHRARLKLIEIEELNDIDSTDDTYDAMVVMGARMGFLMFSARERRFLRNLEHPEKLVLLMTAAVSDWEWEREDVDVITCASREENVEPTYREISRRLDTILEEPAH